MNIERILAPLHAKDFAIASLLDPLALSFSKYVEKKIPWDSCEYRILAKGELTENEILDFRHGGKTEGTPRPDDWLIEVTNSIRDKNNSFYLVEDWQLWPGAPVIEKNSMPAIYNGREVYFYVNHPDPRGSDTLFGICCGNTVPLFHGFVIEGGPTLCLDEAIDADKMEILADSVRILYFGIYDGESYLVVILPI